MARAIRRYWLLSGAALCAVLGGPIAVAQASDNTLRVTLNSYAQKIPNDAHAVKAARTRGQLVRALGHEVTDLRSLKRKLTHESASSARGPSGRRSISGVRRNRFAIATAGIPSVRRCCWRDASSRPARCSCRSTGTTTAAT